MFKVGQTERLVYERVTGLKRVNSMLSTLYNFCSEGAFSENAKTVSLIGASPEEIIIEKEDELVENIKAQVMLEHLSWISTCINLQGCP